MHESADEHTLERILHGNEELAEHNREHFDQLGIMAINFMSAPGAGKTSLLERTIKEICPRWRPCVIEGDMVGELDAERLRRFGTKVFQISTGRSCHLDAQMVARLLHAESLGNCNCLFIENVGNLVCPAEFPLGEHKRVVLLSVTEGDDKPIKYPVIFRNCDAVVFTKCDLLQYVDFDVEFASQNIRALNGGVPVFALSARTGEGFTDWLNWLTQELDASKSQTGSPVPAFTEGR